MHEEPKLIKAYMLKFGHYAEKIRNPIWNKKLAGLFSLAYIVLSYGGLYGPAKGWIS